MLMRVRLFGCLCFVCFVVISLALRVLLGRFAKFNFFVVNDCCLRHHILI